MQCMVNCVGDKIFQFLACVTVPCKGWFFRRGGGGGGEEEQEQETAEHRLEAAFKCSSEYAVSHALQAEQNDGISRLVSR